MRSIYDYLMLINQEAYSLHTATLTNIYFDPNSVEATLLRMGIDRIGII